MNAPGAASFLPRQKATSLRSSASRGGRTEPPPVSRASFPPMASGEAAPAAMPMQTVVLKVSIHCHGCKKKVRKVLKSIEGVHDVKVDAGQHKVTVTGTVDADTLVKRLYKSGKQALLLQPHAAPPPKKPEPAPAPPPPAPAAAPGDGGKDAATPAPAAAAEPVKEPQAEKKPEQEAVSEKKPEAESKKEEAKPIVAEAKRVEAKPSVEAAAPKAKAHDEPAKEAAAAPAPAKEAGNDHVEAKKSEKPKDAGEAPKPVATAERTLSAPPPKHMMYEEYDNYYYPPQPIMSYHAAQPRSSVSYYAPQPQTAYSMQQEPPAGYPQQHQPPPRRAYSMDAELPPPQQQWSPSYLYMPYPHSTPDSYYQQGYYDSPPGSHAPPPLQDSYRMFDDENPNACSVM